MVFQCSSHPGPSPHPADSLSFRPPLHDIIRSGISMMDVLAQCFDSDGKTDRTLDHPSVALRHQFLHRREPVARAATAATAAATIAPPSHHHRTTIAPPSHHHRTTIAPPSHHHRTTIAPAAAITVQLVTQYH